MNFAEKNARRKAARTALREKHGDGQGNRLFRDYRAARRTQLVGGAFGNLKPHDFNVYVIGTSGVERQDSGDAER